MRLPGKNLPQSFEQMLEDGRQTKQNRLYRAQSAEFSAGRISELVKYRTDELKNQRKISLADADSVKKQSFLYLESCVESSTVPTVTGLARALGHSRQSLYDWCSRRPETETAKWLTIFKDTCSDLLADSALRGDVQPIVAIFLEKAAYGMRESVELIAKAEPSPLGPELSREELEARILGNLPEDDF